MNSLDKLIQHLERRECVLFVGDLENSEKQSLNTALVPALVNECGIYCSFCQAEGRCLHPQACDISLPLAAQLYESKTNRQGLIDFVIRYFDKYDQPEAIHRAIAQLPVHVVITTAYDDRLEKAFQQAQRRVSSVVYDTDVPFDDPERVQIIRLNGTISQPDSLMLTEDDLADLFSRLPTVTRILQAHFASKTLFFIGYSLTDTHFLSLYRQVTAPIARFQRLAYAIQKSPNPLAINRWHGKIELIDAAPLDVLNRLPKVTPTKAPQLRQEKPVSLPSEPYKFLDYFTKEDLAIFFGRDLENDLLLSTIIANKVSLFYGRSGAGKTSLLLAKTLPLLEGMGYVVIYARMLAEPLAELKASIQGKPVSQLQQTSRSLSLCEVIERKVTAEQRVILVMDQFEEFFLRHGDIVREKFFQEVADCLRLSPIEIHCVFSLRDDFLGALDEINRYLQDDVFLHRCKVESFTQDKALLAISRPAELFGLSIEPKLKEYIIKDLQDHGSFEPANLQIVLYTLYKDAVVQKLWDPAERLGAGLTVDRYLKLGGTGEILTKYLDDVIGELPNEAKQQRARIILKSMVTADRTKAVVTGKEITINNLVLHAGIDAAEVNEILSYLLAKRVIRKFGEEDLFELSHEILVEKVWAWVSEEEMRLLDVRDMLRRELSNYEKFGYFMDIPKLSLIHQFLEDLTMEKSSLAFVFRSALERGFEVAYWTHRASRAGLEVNGILLDMLGNANFQVRAIALTALEALQEPVFLPRLIEALSDLYPQVRIAAIKALEKLQPTGEWRSKLQYERYVPAGEFILGRGENAHTVFVEAFYINRFLVTNAEYQRYCEQLGQPFNYELAKANDPVVNVTWYHARDYAAWSGMRLPTEAEWEKAASWDFIRQQKYAYPWGNEFDNEKCNSLEAGFNRTTPVGKYSPQGDSPYGCADMAGNVWEWCSSLLKDYPYSLNDGREDLTSSGFRVQRGGSFLNPAALAECTSRVPDFRQEIRYGNFGIRLAWSPKN